MKDHTIHARLSSVCAQRPADVALLDGNRTMSFAALDAASDRVARYLIAHGVTSGDRVGLYSHRSMDAVVAIVGTLKAGAAYVPFDPSYPVNLLKVIHDDCQPSLMLAVGNLMLAPEGPFWRGPWHELTRAITQDLGRVDIPSDNVDSDHPAYIMYTSGSTGRPKGVIIPHRGVMRLVIDNPFVPMNPDQVHLQLAPLAFDASTFEIWGALLNGGRLAIVSDPHPSLDDVANCIAQYGVTTLWLTAGLFHLMIDHRPDGLAPLRHLIAGGDVLSPSHVAKALRALPACQLVNGYGPTENTTFTCCYHIPPTGPSDPIPIGTPINRTVVHILDDEMRPVPPGSEGELYAGGDGLALGYLKRPDLTRERFVSSPFDPSGRTMLYRTGDRVRRRDDGNIEFLGRIDRQIKINGKRVELDEIEACLRRHPLVEDAASISPAARTGMRKIHAFVRFKVDGNSSSHIEELKSYIRSELPDYMVPASYTAMTAMPLSPTGKVDRSKLMPPVPQKSPVAPSRSPAGEVESQLAEIWRSILQIQSVGPNENFFDLGGTSLQLLHCHATIVAKMCADLTIVDLFQYPTIAALAGRLARTGAASSGSPTITDGTTLPEEILTAEARARRQQAAFARIRSHSRGSGK